jgi:hypothetical protein
MIERTVTDLDMDEDGKIDFNQLPQFFSKNSQLKILRVRSSIELIVQYIINLLKMNRDLLEA